MTDDIKTTTTTSPVATPDSKTAAADGKKVSSARAKAKRKVVKQVLRGNVYVQASYNNTIITVTDPNGNVLGWSSAGANGFKGPKKATPYAASVVVKELLTKIAACGLKEVNVFIKGIGGGRESAVRALHINGLNVLSINDVTPIPHNGCRPPKRRRV